MYLDYFSMGKGRSVLVGFVYRLKIRELESRKHSSTSCLKLLCKLTV